MESQIVYSEARFATSPERVWDALTRTGSTSFRYYDHPHHLSPSQAHVGSRVLCCHPDGTELAVGEVVDFVPPHQLVMVLEPWTSTDRFTQVTLRIEAEGEGSKLAVIRDPWFGDGFANSEPDLDLPAIMGSLTRDVQEGLDDDILDFDGLFGDEHPAVIRLSADENGGEPAVEVSDEAPAEPESESSEGAEPAIDDSEPAKDSEEPAVESEQATDAAAVEDNANSTSTNGEDPVVAAEDDAAEPAPEIVESEAAAVVDGESMVTDEVVSVANTEGTAN